MKKLILSVVITALAVAVYAGESKSCADKEGSCCSAKAKTSQEVKGECPMAKQATAGCCAEAAKTKNTVAKRVILQSPKAQAEARG
jgi:hypothetical protein